jgi:hypothetical protein
MALSATDASSAEGPVGYRDPAILWHDRSGPPPYDLVFRHRTIHAGRYRWDIRQSGRPVQSSMDSFATEREAHADGSETVKKLLGFLA